MRTSAVTIVSEPSHTVVTVVDGIPYTVTAGVTSLVIIRPDITAAGEVLRVVGSALLTGDNAEGALDMTPWPKSDHPHLAAAISVAVQAALHIPDAQYSERARHLLISYATFVDQHFPKRR